MRAAGIVLLAALLGSASAGCGDSDEEETGSAKPKASPASASKSPSPSATAADGSDPEACTDGNCEIAVADPMTVRFKLPDGPAKLSLTEVGKNKVGYKVTAGRSRTSGEASGKGSGCIAVFRSGGSSSSCGMAGEAPDEVDSAVVLQVVAGADGTAIVRLVAD